MKVEFTCVFCLLSLALSAVAARPPSVQQCVKTDFAELTKGTKYVWNAKAIEVYRELRSRPQYATNKVARLMIGDVIVKLCLTPRWHTGSWRPKLTAEIPVEARLVLEDPECTLKEKLPFAAHLANWMCSVPQDFAGAEKMVRDLVARDPKATPADRAAGDIILADVYRWQDRFDDAWAALLRAAEGNAPQASAKASALAADTGDWAKCRAVWEKNGGEAAELVSYWTGGGGSNANRPSDYRERAAKYVKDASNPLQKRAALVVCYFCGDRGAEERAMRESVKGADFTKVSVQHAGDALMRAYQFADYALAYELLDYFRDVKGIRWLTPPVRSRMTVVCLGALGRKDEAAKLAESCAADGTCDPVDRAKFLASAAILKGGDPVAAVMACKLEAMKEIEALRTAIRQSLIWGDSPAAERCSAAYEKHFAGMPRRRQEVKWFDEPLQTISDWRKVAGTLEPQYCDIKYRMSMESLVTDVATGRSPVEASALDSNDARMELTTTCDRYGFHIFLRTADPNARAIENGFASGMATEMYFAPGANQPYICFGTTPTEGVQFAFQTMYDNRDCVRLDVLGEKPGRRTFRCETAFTDEDYVLHLFFAWENFYNKLPGKDTNWKYDCLTWTPKGAYNWAGSQGPHSCMAWGDLRFELTDAQITEIRRGLLCRTHKNWRKTGKLDIFEKWADEEIGDPDFAAAKLAPLEKELADAMAGVDLKMSDADVNRIFEAALVKCRGIRHEIDALRKQWLLEEFTK